MSDTNTYSHIQTRTNTRTHLHTHVHTHILRVCDMPTSIVHIRIHTFTHTRVHARLHAHTNTHSYARLHVPTHARTHARTHACMHARTHACTHARTHACMHARIHTRCTHARMHACTQYLHNQNSNLFEKTRSAIFEETRFEVSLPHFPSHRPPRELFLCTPCTQFVTRKEKAKREMHILATGVRRKMNFREDMRIQNIKKNIEKSQAAAAN